MSTLTPGPSSRPSIAIIGAGAIGSILAARLTAAGSDVTLVARGARLETLRKDGLTIRDLQGELHVRPQVTKALEAPVSVLFLCVKGPAIESALQDNIKGLGPDTRVVPLVNGIPWWFFDDLGHPVRAVDPDGALFRMVPFDQIVGAVTMMTAALGADGAVASTIPHFLALGPTTPNGPRPVDLADELTEAGIALNRADYIRPLVWEKLVLNAATNPLSALTGQTLEQIADDPESFARSHAIATEIEACAAAYGHSLNMSSSMQEKFRKAGAFRTSMLQDAEAGRPLELAPILHAPLELAGARGVPMPETARLLADLHAALPSQTHSPQAAL